MRQRLRLAVLCSVALMACGGGGGNSGDGNAAGSSNSSGGSGGSSAASGGTAGTAMTNGSGGASGGAANGSGGVAGATGGDTSSGGSNGGTNDGGGSGGTAEMAGSGGSGGIPVDANGDQIPWRPLNVTAPPDEYRHGFKPSDADPMAVQQNNTQPVGLDTRVPKLVGKLVVDLGYNGGVYYDWLVQRGYHVFGVDFAGVDEVPDVVGQSADFYGDVRLEALEGVDHTPTIDINFHDSMEGHVTYGLAYLQEQYPEEDWGYYLNQDGSVRWSDVIVTGLSHGATSAARWAMVRRLARVVSSSGPRDNTCGTDPTCATGIIATWLSETPKTPIDRFYAITGNQDSQYPEILFAMNRLGYVGDPVDVNQNAPPYNGSHRLTADAGHQRFCGEGDQWDDACNYMFGVPIENQ